MFLKQKINKQPVFDQVEMLKFYKMLLKMKVRRPQFNVNRIMVKLYSKHYLDFINK